MSERRTRPDPDELFGTMEALEISARVDAYTHALGFLQKLKAPYLLVPEYGDLSLEKFVSSTLVEAGRLDPNSTLILAVTGMALAGKSKVAHYLVDFLDHLGRVYGRHVIRRGEEKGGKKWDLMSWDWVKDNIVRLLPGTIAPDGRFTERGMALQNYNLDLTLYENLEPRGILVVDTPLYWAGLDRTHALNPLQRVAHLPNVFMAHIGMVGGAGLFSRGADIRTEMPTMTLPQATATSINLGLTTPMGVEEQQQLTAGSEMSWLIKALVEAREALPRVPHPLAPALFQTYLKRAAEVKYNDILENMILREDENWAEMTTGNIEEYKVRSEALTFYKEMLPYIMAMTMINFAYVGASVSMAVYNDT